MATTTATIRLSLSTKRRLASVARRRGLTLSRYLVEAAEREAEAEPVPLPISPVALEIQKWIGETENMHPDDP